MPMAAPVTAATTGLSHSSSARMKRNTGESMASLPWPGGRDMKSSMSLPLVKTPGWPVISTARTAVVARGNQGVGHGLVHGHGQRVLLFGRAISIVLTPLQGGGLDAHAAAWLACLKATR
jgi:hypothetical protein